MHRVLKTGGRAAVAVWGERNRCGWAEVFPIVPDGLADGPVWKWMALKGGVLYSDFVTTVSPTYAEELCTDDGGFGLAELYRERGESMVGILNGAHTGLCPLALLAGAETVSETVGNTAVSRFVDGMLADEVLLHQPHLIGLQEVALVRRQSPGDVFLGNPEPATEIDMDFLQMYLDALAERGDKTQFVERGCEHLVDETADLSDGGRGGDVWLECVDGLNTLIDYRYQQHFKAQKGMHGMGRDRTGASADDVVAPPYDVVDRAEARALATDRPFSFLHVSRPEIDLPDERLRADNGLPEVSPVPHASFPPCCLPQRTSAFV